MGSQFYIVINHKTPDGWEAFAKFYVGDNRKNGQALFRKLKGTPQVEDGFPLNVDFVEMRNGLPANLDMITCNLTQVGENAVIITKELFRQKLLSLPS